MWDKQDIIDCARFDARCHRDVIQTPWDPDDSPFEYIEPSAADLGICDRTRGIADIQTEIKEIYDLAFLAELAKIESRTL
jgi:hypothetical protein